jgi:hypothetical protein
VGPRQLRAVTEGFASRARGDMLWFHVCLVIFKPQALFDTLLRPAIETPLVRSIQFVLDQEQQELWESAVLSKVQRCRGQAKVQEPCWPATCGRSKRLCDTCRFLLLIGRPERCGLPS